MHRHRHDDDHDGEHDAPRRRVLWSINDFRHTRSKQMQKKIKGFMKKMEKRTLSAEETGPDILFRQTEMRRAYQEPAVQITVALLILANFVVSAIQVGCSSTMRRIKHNHLNRHKNPLNVILVGVIHSNRWKCFLSLCLHWSCFGTCKFSA
jgi:hypothetical protein